LRDALKRIAREAERLRRDAQAGAKRQGRFRRTFFAQQKTLRPEDLRVWMKPLAVTILPDPSLVRLPAPPIPGGSLIAAADALQRIG